MVKRNLRPERRLAAVVFPSMVIESASPAQRLLSRTASSTVTGRNGRESAAREREDLPGSGMAALGDLRLRISSTRN